MSMPAGWYDDGSGRQRWWDGARWTDEYAPAAGAPMTTAPAVQTRAVPALGFVGLGLAVLGTVLACIPAAFGVGVVVLLAGFVVSLIGLFRKGAAKWPSIVGMILSVVGGIVGTIVLLVFLAANLAGPVDPIVPTDTPSSASTAQPSDEPTADAGESRPSPEEIAPAFLLEIQAAGIHDYDDDPEFVACMGQYLYDSEISDEALRDLVEGRGTPESESALVQSVSADGTVFCTKQ